MKEYIQEDQEQPAVIECKSQVVHQFAVGMSNHLSRGPIHWPHPPTIYTLPCGYRSMEILGCHAHSWRLVPAFDASHETEAAQRDKTSEGVLD